jgi:hypothetical protein
MNCIVDLSDRLLPINNEWPDDRTEYQKKRWPNLIKEVADGFTNRGYQMLGPYQSAREPIPFT